MHCLVHISTSQIFVAHTNTRMYLRVENACSDIFANPARTEYYMFQYTGALCGWTQLRLRVQHVHRPTCSNSTTGRVRPTLWLTCMCVHHAFVFIQIRGSGMHALPSSQRNAQMWLQMIETFSRAHRAAINTPFYTSGSQHSGVPRIPAVSVYVVRSGRPHLITHTYCTNALHACRMGGM